MELPCRAAGDELLKQGELIDLRRRLRQLSSGQDISSVIVCAFDHRTRILPFIYADMRMVPGGVRAIGSAMVDIGLPQARIVLGQWNRNFRPSAMRLDGRMPDILMISSMQIHWHHGRALLRDICRLPASERPLVIVGGPKIIYQPWDAFSADSSDPYSADLAVTGEEHVLLSALEVLLRERGTGERLRDTFLRARDGGMLDGVAGLVYARGCAGGVAEELVDTGIQRLAGNLDELPDPVAGYGLLEAPSGGAGLASSALAAGKVRKHCRIGSLVLTSGCKFSCSYCPIPAYNQRQHRCKSGDRIGEEMYGIYRAYGIRHFFMADDNFFNRKERSLAILETLASKEIDGLALRRKMRWATEATVHDTLAMEDHLSLVRKAGVRALWIGVEDMTGKLVNKGQAAEKTLRAFRMLNAKGICPMPMMMHHDKQPLFSPRGTLDGLINQARVLRKAGATSLQVLMITPAPGSRVYVENFASGQTYSRVGGKALEAFQFDGNYVVSSWREKPWRMQLNILAAYAYFYNPLRLMLSLVRPKTRLYLADFGMQLLGMYGLLKSARRTLPWVWRLWRGNIERSQSAPMSAIPMRGVNGQPASHDLRNEPTKVQESRRADEPVSR